VLEAQAREHRGGMSKSDDSQKNQQDKPANPVPVHSVAIKAAEFDFSAGDEFWAKVEKLAGDSKLVSVMDQVMEGHSAPRIWLILHEPGEPEWAAGVAMAFASQLSGRDQVALVLDCDDRGLALTNWADRKECEGWIDLARYGISLMAAGLPMPFSGRRGYFLGVGSFAPTDVTSEEIQTVMNRLRRQADDLILVAPADDVGKLWAAGAHIRLLAWNQDARPVSELSGLVSSLAADGCALTGMVGLGIRKASESRELIVEPVEPVEAPEVSASEADARDGMPSLVADESPAPDSKSVEVDTKSTSGVFWLLATAAVVIVVIMGVYWYQYVRDRKSVV